MNTADALCSVDTDHGHRIVTIGGVGLVDLRGELPDTPSLTDRTMHWRDPSLVTFAGIHHDAGFYDGRPLETDPWPNEIRRIHNVYDQHRANGWGGIGYHIYAFPSGRRYLVGDLDTQRASVRWRNHETIGIVAAGDWTETPPPVGTQLAVALSLLAVWTHLRRLTGPLGHREAARASDPTACPGDAYRQWVPRLPELCAKIAPSLRS